MPALRICGRRWRLDSDDLAIPFVLYVFLHVAALLTLSVIYLPSASTSFGTRHSIKLLNSSNSVKNISKFNFDNITEPCLDLGSKTFFTALSIYSIELLLEFIIILFSFRGTVGNPEPRRHINKLLYFRIVIGFVEFFIWCWNLTGLIQPELIYPETSNSTSSCSIHASIQIIFITYSSIEFLLTLFLLFLTYDSMGRSNMYSYKKDENYYFKRLRFLFCCTRLSFIKR